MSIAGESVTAIKAYTTTLCFLHDAFTLVLSFALYFLFSMTMMLLLLSSIALGDYTA
jgi:hypothetical protein